MAGVKVESFLDLLMEVEKDKEKILEIIWSILSENTHSLHYTQDTVFANKLLAITKEFASDFIQRESVLKAVCSFYIKWCTENSKYVQWCLDEKDKPFCDRLLEFLKPDSMERIDAIRAQVGEMEYMEDRSHVKCLEKDLKPFGRRGYFFELRIGTIFFW